MTDSTETNTVTVGAVSVRTPHDLSADERASLIALLEEIETNPLRGLVLPSDYVVTLHGEILVELWDCDLGVACIVEHKSGVVWTNQVGGTCCLHPSLEGVLVPVASKLVEKDSLEDRVGATRQDVARWLREQCLDRDFEAREPDDPIETADATSETACEAWLTVYVSPNPQRIELRPFAGRRAVLTYQNSD